MLTQFVPNKILNSWGQRWVKSIMGCRILIRGYFGNLVIPEKFSMFPGYGLLVENNLDTHARMKMGTIAWRHTGLFFSERYREDRWQDLYLGDYVKPVTPGARYVIVHKTTQPL